MSAPVLRLTISTPGAVLVDATDVVSVRAEDDSGGFGVLPGHAALVTVLPPSVVRWRDRAGAQRYCALRGGVFSVTGGARVAIAAREGVVGVDLEALEAEVREMRATELETERAARVDETRLRARAIRQLMRYLRPDATPVGESPARAEPPE